MATTASALDLAFDEAVRFYRQKANVTTRTWTDVYAAAHSRAFMVAGAASDAIVADFRAAIDKAIAEGSTLDEFRRDFDAIVERYGWSHTGGRNWRSRVIFETNLRTAYAAGRYEQLTRPETLEAFPFWQYNHSGALHPRLDHLSWDGLVLSATDTFWQTNYPPNGWGCGCYVIPVSGRDLRRQGKSGPDQAPDLVFRAEEVGGRTVRVPTGVDPGFEYNPGREWLARTAPGSETVAAAPGVIRRFVEAAAGGSWPDDSYVPVAVMSLLHRRLFGAAADAAELRLTARTVRSHLHHPEAIDAYGRLAEFAISEAAWIRDEHGRLTALFIDPQTGRRWMLGILPSDDGSMRVATLHYSEERKHRSRRRRGTLVLEKGKAPGGSGSPH